MPRFDDDDDDDDDDDIVHDVTPSVREYVFYVFFTDFKKHDFLRFFEMMFQKNVKSHRKYQVC